MKSICRIFIAFIALLAVAPVGAQEQNKLSVATVTVPAGQSVSLSFQLDNTSPVIGAQFTVTMPAGTSLDVSDLQWTDRRVDHEAVVKRKSGTNDYQVLVFSPSNTAFRYYTGALFSLTATISAELEEGHSYPVSIGSNAVLANADGTNVLTALGDGAIVIAASPDLVIENVTADKNTYAPGLSITASWTIRNIGGASLLSGWREYISLTKDGNQVLIATHSNNLEDEEFVPGASAARNLTIQLPNIIGIDGDCRLQVRVEGYYDAGERPEYTSNNTTSDNATVSISKRLYLELPEQVDESATGTANCYVYRSGDIDMDETVTIVFSGSNRIQLPASVLIPAGESGASFDMEVTDNAVCDADTSAEITFSMPGYPEVNHIVYIEDNEQPTLSAFFSPDTIMEGGSATLTVSTDVVRAHPVTLYLSCGLPHRFDLPETIVLPANQSSVQLVMHMEDDELPSEDIEVVFYVTADNYNEAECSLVIQDNDIPDITLTINPSTISENAGPVAMTATLRRSGKTDNRVTINLSDDSEGALFYTKSSVIMEAGVTESSFAMGVNDNNLVDGERVVTVTAAVYLSACNCSAAGTDAGTVTSTVTILDDDGPALTLQTSNSNLLEGRENAAILTITRNTSVDEPLYVDVDVDNSSGLIFDHNVTIPIGSASASMVVGVAKDDIEDNNRIVTFSASHNNFTPASITVTVIDRTMPDAAFSGFEVTKESLLPEEEYEMHVTITSCGAVALPKGLRLNIYSDNELDTVVYTAERIEPESEYTVILSRRADNNLGTKHCYATINEDQRIPELFFNNNTSATISTLVSAPYSASVSIDKTICKEGDSILLSGSLSGSQIGNVITEVYAISNNYRYAFPIKTDNTGHFRMKFAPSAGQFGHFSFGACYPSQNLNTEMAYADWHGFKLHSDKIYCHLQSGVDYHGEIYITNKGTLPLTNIRVEPLFTTYECQQSFGTIPMIAENETASLDFTLQQSVASNRNDWDTIPIRIISDQSITATTCLYCFTHTSHGQMLLSANSINMTINTETPTDYTLYIYNSGYGETGAIMVSLPDWIKQVSSQEISSLQPGDTATIHLRMEYKDYMPLNVPIQGNIVINAANADGISLPYSIEPVSNQTGELHIEVCDEYTFYAPGNKKVSNAEIVISHPSTGLPVAQGRTNANGVYDVALPAGYYTLSVNADSHSSYMAKILLNADRRLDKQVILTIRPLEVSFTIEETEIEDEYQIVTHTNFETNVPVPQVVLDIPSMEDAANLAEGESLLFTVTATNEGLITAEDVSLIWPSENTDIIIEPLAYIDPFDLPAGQTVRIPIRVSRRAYDNLQNAPSKSKRVLRQMIGCYDAVTNIYYWDCGPDRHYHMYTYPFRYDVCDNIVTRTLGELVIRITDVARNTIEEITRVPLPNPVPDNPDSVIILPPIGPPIIHEPDTVSPIIRDYACEPCRNYYLLRTLECATNFIPLPGPLQLITTIFQCDRALDAILAIRTEGLPEFKKQWSEITSCFEGVIETGLSSLGISIPFQAIHDCIVGFRTPCDHMEGLTQSTTNTNNNNKKYKRVEGSDNEPQYITKIRDVATIISDVLDKINSLDTIYIGQELNAWITDAEKRDLLNAIALHNNTMPYTEGDFGDVWPASAPDSCMQRFIVRLENTRLYANGEDYTGERINLEELQDALIKLDSAKNDMNALGYSSFDTFWQTEFDLFKQRIDSAASGVCASIKLSFPQQMVLSRQAFRGTLEVYNGHESLPITNMRLNLQVYNKATGLLATTHEMTIEMESLNGFIGENTLNSNEGWLLEPDTKGVATIMFIPTKYAAPTDTVIYSIGGTISYFDPYSQSETERILYPVDIKVLPTPDLSLTFFMQRDVFADDPLTTDEEESIPAEFALLIDNQGYGSANNLKFTTPIPQIVDNQKGLRVEFNMLYSTLNGERKEICLDNEIPSNFGSIQPHSQAYAQWYFKSSLLGHFTDYDVSYTHVTSYGNPELSLIDTITIHEMAHSIGIPAYHPTKIGWLVNDIDDINDMPDTIYVSDATGEALHVVSSISIEQQNDSVYVLSCTPEFAGWNYGVIEDPNYGKRKIKSVIRLSDGESLSDKNYWQTPCVLRDGKDPIRTPQIHIADAFSSTTSWYILFGEEPQQPEIPVQTQDTVFVQNGEVLDISGMDEDTILNIVVEPGGELNVNWWDIRLGVITIITAGGQSGQIHNAEYLANWRFFMEYKLNPFGQTASPNLWYAFAVPFEVDIATGITRAYGKKSHVPGVDFQILEYDGWLRATTGKGWVKKNTGSLEPGTFYMIGIEGNCNRWLFEKKSDAAVQGDSHVNLNPYFAGNSDNGKHNGWNGKGNSRLEYSEMDLTGIADFLYLYNNEFGKFELTDAAGIELCVGQPFFVQASADASFDFTHGGGSLPMPALRAPQTAKPQMHFTLTSDKMHVGTDHLYVTMHEDAATTYTIGRDVARMSMNCQTAAQLWCLSADGTELAAHDIALPETETVIPLGIFAPQNGEYLLNMSPRAADDFEVELLYQGAYAATLFADQPLALTLNAGTTTGYSIRVRRRMPTEIDQVPSDQVQCTKVLIDNHLYILKGIHIFDAQGKQVK